MKLFRAGITSVCEEEVAIRESGKEDEILDGDRNDLGLSLFPAVIIQTLLFTYLEWKGKIPSAALLNWGPEQVQEGFPVPASARHRFDFGKNTLKQY